MEHHANIPWQLCTEHRLRISGLPHPDGDLDLEAFHELLDERVVGQPHSCRQ